MRRQQQAASAAVSASSLSAGCVLSTGAQLAASFSVLSSVSGCSASGPQSQLGQAVEAADAAEAEELRSAPPSASVILASSLYSKLRLRLDESVTAAAADAACLSEMQAARDEQLTAQLRLTQELSSRTAAAQHSSGEAAAAVAAAADRSLCAGLVSPPCLRSTDWQARSQKDAHRAAETAAAEQRSSCPPLRPADRSLLRLCSPSQLRLLETERESASGAAAACPPCQAAASRCALPPSACLLPYAVSCHKAALDRSESDLRCLHAQLTAKDSQSRQHAAALPGGL